MALADLIPKKISIDVGSGELELSPLTLSDIAILARDHGVVLGDLVQGKIDLSEAIQLSPQFVGAMIALSAGEPNHAEIAMKLPIGAQLKAIEAIWSISMTSGEDIANFIAKLLEGMVHLSAALKKTGSKPS